MFIDDPIKKSINKHFHFKKKSKYMLFIESDLTTSLLFKERLDFYNIKNYKIAKNGVEAYKILYETELKNQFKFIITSIGLPDENGLEIIKFIRKNFTSKIIVYTTKKCYKNKIIYDFFYDKKLYSPTELIDMIVSENFY